MLLRIILQDDAHQAAVAERCLQELTSRDPGFVSLVVLSELIWVLGRKYRYSREQLASVLASLLNIAALQVEQAEVVRKALEAFRVSNADFADCCISALAAAAGCKHTVTFDIQAAKLPGMLLLE